jgi:hypothetical protein
MFRPDGSENPESVYGGSGSSGGRIITKVYPPTPDESDDYLDPRGRGESDDDSGDFVRPARSSSGRRSDRETMGYTAYYGDPNASVFAPLDARGYEKGNLTTSTTASSGDPSGGLMGEVRKKRGRDEIGASFDEDGGDDRDNGKGKDKRKFNKRRRGHDDDGDGGGEGNGGWRAAGDPFGSGRSIMLAELKDAYFALITPLTRLAERYLNATGANITDEERLMNHYIQVRSVFNSAVENQDWEGLVNALYGPGKYPTTGFDPSDLADALVHLVSQGKKASKPRGYGYGGEEETEAELSRLSAIEELKRMSDRNPVLTKTALYLSKAYNTMASGKVVFMLNPLLRTKAETVLEIINEKYRGGAGRPPFTLMEMMRSEGPLTQFVDFIVMKDKVPEMVGMTGPTHPGGSSSSYGGGGGLIPRRQRVYQPGGNYTYVQNYVRGPTVANHNAASSQYHALLGYFATVEKANDGSGSLISVNPAARAERERRSRASEEYERSFLYDPLLQAYVKVDLDAFRVPRELSKPIESLDKALDVIHDYPDRRIDVYQGKHADVNPRVLSYVNKEGDLKLAHRTILLDPGALKGLYERGTAGQYDVQEIAGRREEK